MAIQGAVRDVIRDSPRVLINTISGRLLDKYAQAASFESLPIFNRLISSMTTYIDHTRIEHDVMQYYRYAMFSHTWEANEPLYERVIHIVVYDLEESFTHEKLQMFCRVVRDAGLHWAWSDTCCINRTDNDVLQEALVSMFRWYQCSAMTVVLLSDVCSPSRRGNLVKSIWNTRAWTLQEYLASKVVRFYNKDWTLYRNLDIPNHKESPEIISEMEEATGISARALMALRPGLDDIREKLCLASTRQTTLVEDAAYSLFGIFSLSLPVVYGEGDKALGRLFAQLLTSSGNTSVLAWSGKSGNFNSCLPANITVFDQLAISHVPRTIPVSEMDGIVAGMRTSGINLTSLTKLYNKVDELPVPSFVDERMKLPCIAFTLGSLPVSPDGSEFFFRVQTDGLGIVEISTKEDLSQMHSLYLVHPWIDFLLDRQPGGNVTETKPEAHKDDLSSLGQSASSPDPPSITSTSTSLRTQTTRFFSHFGLLFSAWGATQSRDSASPQPPSLSSQTDKQTRVLQFLARLRQPFGALLLTPAPDDATAYRRVAAECKITVQVNEATPAVLDKLVDSVRILDVL